MAEEEYTKCKREDVYNNQDEYYLSPIPAKEASQ